MYEPHAKIATPPDGCLIWRYITLEKLLSMLSTKSLYMCRIDRFRDKWEGIWPKKVIESVRALQGRHAEGFVDTADALRKTFYVNCWHMNEHESAALWDAYSGRAGLAIRSTIGRLKRCITDPEPANVGRVEYLDFLQDSPSVDDGNPRRPAFLKRKSFEHEREVRVLVWRLRFNKIVDERNPDVETARVDYSLDEESYELEVKLRVLIESVYLSPESPEWLVPHVEQLLSAFRLKGIPVRRSSLYDERIY